MTLYCIWFSWNALNYSLLQLKYMTGEKIMSDLID